MKLQQLQIFQNLTEEELEKSLVCSQAVVKKYPKDTYIFRQGDVPLNYISYWKEWLSLAVST